MARFPNVFGRSYVAANPISDQERTINMFAERMESKGATAPISFMRTPGVQPFVQVAKVGYRAMFEMNGRSFGVVQDGLYEFTFPAEVGTATLLGTVALDGNPATISSNGQGGNQLFITSGDKGYCFDLLTNTLTEELSSGATQGGYLGGYFLAFDATLGRVRYSDLLDGTSWDPTNFFDRTNQPDDWQAMMVTSWDYICLPGGQTCEFWFPNGGFPLPFAPDPAGSNPTGIAAPFSLANAGGTLVWLDGNADGGYQVMAASGLSPQRISDHALEQKLASYARETTVEDAIGQSFRMNGHVFYRLTFPSANAAWQFDFSTGWWTEVLTWIAEESEYTYFRPVFHCFAFGKHLMGDRESGVLYELHDSFHTDIESRPIRWLRRTPAIVSEQRKVFHRKLVILMETGEAAQGETPVLMLRYSDDGGKTWGNEVTCEVGEIGDYDALVWFYQLGMARNRVYELTGTSAIAWRLTDSFIDADVELRRAS